MSPGRKCKDGEAPVVTVRANAWALTVIQVPKRELHYDIGLFLYSTIVASAIVAASMNLSCQTCIHFHTISFMYSS